MRLFSRWIRIARKNPERIRVLFVCQGVLGLTLTIINWNSKKKQEQSGRVETYRLEDVPKDILDVATRAACAMGDGLYGVDIKVSNGSIYVIEVNDNPNIDNQTEDRVLKDELYKTVIRSLLTRIENARGQKRNVS